MNIKDSLFPPGANKSKTLTIGAVLLAMLGYLVELRSEVAVISSKVERIERTMEQYNLISQLKDKKE